MVSYGNSKRKRLVNTHLFSVKKKRMCRDKKNCYLMNQSQKMKHGKQKGNKWLENAIDVDRFHVIRRLWSFDKNVGKLFCDEMLS